MKHSRFFNMYLTTTISVAMVLFLIGLECVILLTAHTMMDRVRENLALTVVMNNNVNADEIARLKDVLEAVPYTQSFQFISKDDALQEHIKNLGEDPTKFLGYNPLMDSYELHLKADYACIDSIASVISQLSALPYVERVVYQEDIVKVLDSNVSEVSFGLLVCAAILLIIAWVLIVNTIRLHVYSKRFLINTMRLVGATQWVIRAPFIRRNVRMGVEAALLSLVVIAGLLFFAFRKLGVLLFDLTWQNLAFIAAVVCASGIVITFFAALFATGRYVRMKTDKMYEI